MDQMKQHQDQYARSDDAIRDSPVDQGVQGLSINSPDDHTREGEDHPHEKKSLISKVKDKAKDKMLKAKDKLKTKLKKDKHTVNGTDEEDSVEDDAEVHPKSLLETPTHEYLADGSYVNHGKPLDTFGVSPTRDHAYSSTGDEQPQREYAGFLRSSKGEPDGSAEDLTSVPTDYSSPRASVDAIMPPPVISPGSTSELGEQSSSSLGEIPEKPKEEEKVVASESKDEKFQPSPSIGSFGDTTEDKLSLSDEEKDLEDIERNSMSQELGDGSKETKFNKNPSGRITEQPREETEQSFTSKVEGELPSDEAAVPLRVPEKRDEEEPERLTDKADRELTPTEAAVEYRGSEKGAGRPLRDPDVEMPVPQGAEFTESMFSSSVANDLRERENSTGRKEPKESQGPGVAGVSGRDFNYEEGNTTLTQNDQVQEATKPAKEQEEFHDPQLDVSSLETKKSASVYSDDYGEQKGKFAQDGYLDLDDEEEGKKGGAGFLSSVSSALGSAAGAVGTKVGYSPAPEKTFSDATSSDGETASVQPESSEQGKVWTQLAAEKTKDSRPPITPQNSTVEELDSDASAPSQSWISKVAGILSGDSNKKEDTIEEKDEEDSGHQRLDKEGGDRQAFADAPDAFVR